MHFDLHKIQGSINRLSKQIQVFLLFLVGGFISAISLSFVWKFVKAKKNEGHGSVNKIRRAATLGNAQDQIKLGVLYALGLRGQPDYQEAVFWLRKAAETGEPNAQLLVSFIYLEGLGVRRSYVQAVRWARLSALQGNPIAQLIMGAFLEEGVGIKRDMERAHYWYQQTFSYPIEIGARQRLGMLYLEGRGCPQDTAQAVKCFQEAASKGDVHAAFQLGMIYYDGRLLEQNYDEALKYYLMAAQRKHTEKEGLGLEFLFGEAAVPGEVYTKTIAQIMKRGIHVQRDAQFYVGLMYETGRGVEQELNRARDWYQKAADAGDDIAKQRVVFLKTIHE